MPYLSDEWEERNDWTATDRLDYLREIEAEIKRLSGFREELLLDLVNQGEQRFESNGVRYVARPTKPRDIPKVNLALLSSRNPSLYARVTKPAFDKAAFDAILEAGEYPQDLYAETVRWQTSKPYIIFTKEEEQTL